LRAEARGGWAAVSVSDGRHTYTSEIVEVKNLTAGGVGLIYEGNSLRDSHQFALRESPRLVQDQHLERRLSDAHGVGRGDLRGGGLPVMEQFGIRSWDAYGKEKIILLDAYKPERRLPYGRDWVLVLDATQRHHDDKVARAH